MLLRRQPREKNECGLVNEDCLQHQRYVLTHKYYYQLCEKKYENLYKIPSALIIAKMMMMMML